MSNVPEITNTPSDPSATVIFKSVPDQIKFCKSLSFVSQMKENDR